MKKSKSFDILPSQGSGAPPKKEKKNRSRSLQQLGTTKNYNPELKEPVPNPNPIKNPRSVKKIAKKHSVVHAPGNVYYYKKILPTSSQATVFLGHTVSKASNTEENDNLQHYINSKDNLQIDEHFLKRQSRRRTIFTHAVKIKHKAKKELRKERPVTPKLEDTEDQKSSSSSSVVIRTKPSLHKKCADEQQQVKIENDTKKKPALTSRRAYLQKIRELNQAEVKKLAEQFLHANKDKKKLSSNVSQAAVRKEEHKRPVTVGVNTSPYKEQLKCETSELGEFQTHLKKLKKYLTKKNIDGKSNDHTELLIQNFQKFLNSTLSSKSSAAVGGRLANGGVTESKKVRKNKNNTTESKITSTTKNTTMTTTTIANGQNMTMNQVNEYVNLNKNENSKMTSPRICEVYHASVFERLAWTNTNTVKCSTVIENNGSSSGYLLVHENCTKKASEPLQNNIYFIHHKGNITFTIAGNTFTPREMDQFFVPLGTTYSIQNLSACEKAILSYVKVKSVSPR